MDILHITQFNTAEKSTQVVEKGKISFNDNATFEENCFELIKQLQSHFKIPYITLEFWFENNRHTVNCRTIFDILNEINDYSIEKLITKVEFRSWYNSSMGDLFIYFPESTESLLKLHNTLDWKGDLTII